MNSDPSVGQVDEAECEIKRIWAQLQKIPLDLTAE